EGLHSIGGYMPQVDNVHQGDKNNQVPIMEEGNEVLVVLLKMANGEIREALLTLARAMTTQVNRDIGLRVNAMESTMTSRFRDFRRMNPPIFFGSKVGEDPQPFLDIVYKIVHAMGVTSREKAELVSYQLKYVAQVWCTK
ncbi:hypothetical protein EJD97_010881, partial [Solanum chilense]